MQQNNFEYYNETKHKIESKISIFVFSDLKNKILGENFHLSLSILNPKNSQKINIEQRKKDYIPNTLSFKYSKNSGEIILTPEVILKEDYPHPKDKNLLLEKFEDKIIYLYIHSLLHLTDLDHGKKMENLEAKFLKPFVL